MTRAGGQSTAAGISFQALAIARAILDVYLGRIASVRPEVPQRADFGEEQLIPVSVDDYVVEQLDGTRIYYQAKSSASGKGNWTITKLWREEILQKFVKQLFDDPTGICCLITSCDCPLLGELSERAQHAPTFKEFIVNLAGEYNKIFKSASQNLDVEEIILYELLKRCRLERITSERLKHELESLTSGLFADPLAAADCLQTLAIQAMKTGQIINQANINELYFSKRSVFAKPKGQKTDLLTTIRNASSCLRMAPKDIAGIHIPQQTVESLIEWVTTFDPQSNSIAVLLDQAGSGKTVAMSNLLIHLEKQEYVVLGIKVDGLEFSSKDELASILGLQDSISSVLQFLKQAGERIVLLIDQIDALSSAMARNSSGINVILDLIAQVSGLGIPIVLACRSFDWKYDYRLKQLQQDRTKIFTLPEFTDEQLAKVLSVCSLKLTDLHPLMIKIVRCPLRLKMFIEVVQEKRKIEPGWVPHNTIYTLQTLYQDFWDLKMNKASSDGINTTECEAIVVTLAQKMHDSEVTSVPEGAVAGRQPAKNWLISEGILHRDGKVLSFFHQTFFDFMFARWFVGNNRSLVEHLLASDQGLFYRPMVRQILEYLRNVDYRRYLYELKGILENKNIRKHLRWLTIEWLGHLQEPTCEELALLEPFLIKDETRRKVLECLRGNPAWFDRLTATRFDCWLRALPEIEVRTVIWYLRTILPQRQVEITSLLAKYVGKSEAWNNQIAFCLAELKDNWEAPSVNLLYNVLRSPLTDVKGKTTWWAMALNSLAKHSPSEACKAIAIVLHRFNEAWEQKRQENSIFELFSLQNINHLFPSDYQFAEALKVSSENAPTEFLEQVLPWVLAVMDKSCYSYNGRKFKENWYYWSIDHPLENSNPSGKLLAAITTATKNLVKSNPATFRTLVPKLTESQCLPMQIIVSQAYSENPAEFVTDAAYFLTSDPRRLQLGELGNPVWHSKQLIAACSPIWSDEDFRRVEQAIISIKPDTPSSLESLKYRDMAQLELLRALDRGRLSMAGLSRLGQLERKFPDFQSMSLLGFEMDWVGPPIPQESIKKMTDDGWLGAMQHYVEERSHNKPIRLSGGRRELARSLKEVAKEQPERFYHLAIDKMDLSFQVDYVKAIIEGIAEGGAPVEYVEALVRKFIPLLNNDADREIAWSIRKYAGQDVPEYLVNLLKRWAEQAINPVADGDTVFEKSSKQHDTKLDLFTEGINTDRGAALDAIAVIILKANPPRRAEYLEIANKVVADPSAEVRAVCIHYLPHAIPADPLRTCELFQRLVSKDRELLREQGAYEFVYYSLYRHASEVLWAIEAMLTDSESPEAREAGAKLACLAAFSYAGAESLRDACLNGDVAMRKGAAAVYSANIMDPHVGNECRQRLLKFMEDDNEEVREEATRFLRELQGGDLVQIRDFLREWSKTKSLVEGADDAAYMLEQNPVVDSELTLEISDRLISVLGGKIADIQSRHGLVSHHLTPAILNVYHYSTDIRIRSRAIDLFERLKELGCHEVHLAMESIDRL